jgi:hypothetical protein
MTCETAKDPTDGQPCRCCSPGSTTPPLSTASTSWERAVGRREIPMGQPRRWISACQDPIAWVTLVMEQRLCHLSRQSRWALVLLLLSFACACRGRPTSYLYSVDYSGPELDVSLRFLVAGQEVRRSASPSSARVQFDVRVPAGLLFSTKDVFQILLQSPCGEIDLWPLVKDHALHDEARDREQAATRNEPFRIHVSTINHAYFTTSALDVHYDNRDQDEQVAVAVGKLRLMVPGRSAGSRKYPRPPCAEGEPIVLGSDAVGKIPSSAAGDGLYDLFLQPSGRTCYCIKKHTYVPTSVGVGGGTIEVRMLRGERIYRVPEIRHFRQPAPESLRFYGYMGSSVVRNELSECGCAMDKPARRRRGAR